jgi:hypothetical protein
MSAPLRDCLNSEYILCGRSYTIEEGELFTQPTTEEFGRDFARYLKKTPSFRYIWSGSLEEQQHLTLRLQISTDSKGRLLYNGKPYKKNSWCSYFVGDCKLYGPPKVIRQMGRVAREIPNPANVHPEISILTARGEVLRLDACTCGGELVMDHRGVLYCSNCFVIYE